MYGYIRWLDQTGNSGGISVVCSRSPRSLRFPVPLQWIFSSSKISSKWSLVIPSIFLITVFVTCGQPQDLKYLEYIPL